MAVIISIVNQKGGVAKTTTAVNAAAALGAMGKKVLLVDLDPQGNATAGLGISGGAKRELEYTTYDVIMGEVRPAQAVVQTKFKNLWLMPSTQALAEAEIKLLKFENKNLQLKKAILQIRDEYDIIVIDCLPSLGVLALNGLNACDRIIIPMQCEPYSLEGVAELIAIVKRVKKSSNRNLQIMGIVFTMVDNKLKVNREVMRAIKSKFPEDIFFNAEIPRNVRLTEAPSHGEPIMYYDPNSKGADAYARLSREIARKCKAMEEML